jgi:predicted transcriptional regulator
MSGPVEVHTAINSVLNFVKKRKKKGAIVGEVSSALEFDPQLCSRTLVGLHNKGFLSRDKTNVQTRYGDRGYRYYYIDDSALSQKAIFEQLEKSKLQIPRLCMFEIRYHILDILNSRPDQYFTSREIFLRMNFSFKEVSLSLISIRTNHYAFSKSLSPGYKYKWKDDNGIKSYWKELSSVRLKVMSYEPDEDFEISDLMSVKHKSVSLQDIVFFLTSGIREKKIRYRYDEKTKKVYCQKIKRPDGPTIL